MNVKSVLTIIFMLLFFISSNAQSINKTVVRNADFAFEFFKQTLKKDTSICFSPYSISFALSMAYAGARNETKAQISRVLHFDEELQTSNAAFSEIQRQLNLFKGDTSIRLVMANAIWRKKEEAIRQEYADVLRTYYNAQVNPITNAKAINDWVKTKTNNKIDNIISDDALTGMELLLTNAVYFKGPWLNEFDEKNTRKDTFHVDANTQNTIDMMYQKKDFLYLEDRQSQVLEMPYKGYQVSMILVLPKKGVSITEIVSTMNYQTLDNYTFSFGAETVKVFLPKFSFTSSFELIPELQQMGLTDPFSARADFSGMAAKGLFISKVSHKTFIEVNEKGTEAAAVTVVGASRGANSKVYEFNADRPFLFFIVDRQTGTVLFMGSVVNPTEVNGKNAKVYTGPRK